MNPIAYIVEDSEHDKTALVLFILTLPILLTVKLILKAVEAFMRRRNI